MPHFLVVAALVLGAWAVLSLPLGVLVGRRLKHVNPLALPAGCAFGTAAEDGAGAVGPIGPVDPAEAEPSVPSGWPPGAVPGCTAHPCRAGLRAATGARSCAEPRAGHRGFGGATG